MPTILGAGCGGLFRSGRNTYMAASSIDREATAPAEQVQMGRIDRWRLVGEGGGDNGVCFSKQALPALVFWPSIHPAATVFATARQYRRRIATVGKSEPRRRGPCPMR